MVPPFAHIFTLIPTCGDVFARHISRLTHNMAMRSFLALMMERACVIRALKVSILVGTVLALINHSTSIFYGTMGAGELLQVIVTYAVPFTVSSYSSAAQERYLRSLQPERVHN
jgi:hypothetical protein